MTFQEWAMQSGLKITQVAPMILAAVRATTTLDPLSFLSAHGKDTLTSSEASILNQWRERLTLGEPLQYILGQSQFGDLTLKTDRRALIPRQETEELVNLVISHLKSFYTLRPKPPALEIADIGTGAGPIACALAAWAIKNKRKISLIATEVSLEALELAQENAKSLGLDDFITFRAGSLLAPLKDPVDIIVANLPYIPSHWLDNIDESVVDFEPHIALDGGPKGLDLISQMLHDAPRVLKPGGTIFLEMWHEHTANQLPLDQYRVVTSTDSFGKPRFAILTSKNKR